jgi:prepilin-type N-terminal cleavage/methylation domain-containing protein
MKRRAFTLIELLIVVAIIAVLAAIAIPNFLEAQVRSKVSRVKSDMRSVATALEAYAADRNAYPPPLEYLGQTAGGAWLTREPSDETLDGFVSYRLTSPVAYISSLPYDVFETADEDDAEHPRRVCFHYSEQHNNETVAHPQPTLLRDLAEQVGYGGGNGIRWLMFSHGPDLVHQDGSPKNGDPVLYDPTNGTVSRGDIYCFGPGVSMK